MIGDPISFHKVPTTFLPTRCYSREIVSLPSRLTVCFGAVSSDAEDHAEEVLHGAHGGLGSWRALPSVHYETRICPQSEGPLKSGEERIEY